MADDSIRYDVLAQDALRGVIRTVLTRVAKSGLPGQHHLYISFDTQAPGAYLSKRLRQQYPEEMTIVLQYQFWDLLVSEDRFEVKLSFNNVPERLVVPFAAVKAFFDPSVQFGLQFGAQGPANDQARAEGTRPLANIVKPPVDDLSPLAGRDEIAALAGRDEPAESPPPEPVEPPDRPAADVVELDAFRNKK